MIPKFIFDKSQTLLNVKENNTQDISIKEKLINYRKMLYRDVYEKLNIMKVQKETLIKSYKTAIEEIDLAIQQQEYEEEYYSQSLNKGDKKKTKMHTSI